MRIKFKKGGQKEWIDNVINKSKLSTEEIAKICGTSSRTIRNWRSEKYKMSAQALEKICKYTDSKKPQNLITLNDYWYVNLGARKGALRRAELYGSLGTREGRIKGGKVSQARRRENPKKYRALGCNVRKEFTKLRKSINLAEAVGIILGDGCVSKSQLCISLGLKNDYKYAIYVRSLLSKVIGERPTMREYNSNIILLTISGVNLIENLQSIGIYKGDKIAHQVDIPSWILQDINYQKACVKGLMDTDGGAYFHRHWVRGKRYRNFGLSFTSNSKPLLGSFSKIIRNVGINHSIQKNRFYIYSLKEVERYYRIIGSNNPKNWERLSFHLSKSRRIG